MQRIPTHPEPNHCLMVIIKKVRRVKKMNPQPLYDLILSTTGLADMNSVAASLRNPPLPAYAPAREVTVSFELSGKDGLVELGHVANGAKFHPKKAFNDLPYNLNDVSITTLVVRHVKNHSTTNRMQVCRTFDPITNREEGEEANRLQVAMGVIPGCAVDVGPGFDGPQMTFLIRENPQCLYLQNPFISTCMHTDATNLMNGIIVVPPAICALANLPKSGILFDASGQSVDVPADYYVLVPGKHLLAWQLDIGEGYRRLKGFHAFEIVGRSDGAKYAEIVYFVVSNQTFNRLREDCISNLLTNKVDRRPLSSVGVRIIGEGTVTLSITYICHPTMSAEMKSQLAPFLDKKFPLYADVISREIEARRMRETEEREQQMMEHQQQQSSISQ